MTATSWKAWVFCGLLIFNYKLHCHASPATDPTAIRARIQYLTSIDKSTQTAITGSHIFGASNTPSLIYTFMDAIAALGTGPVNAAYDGAKDPSVTDLVPSADMTYISGQTKPAEQDLRVSDPGYKAASRSADASQPGVLNLGVKDPILDDVCAIFTNAIPKLEKAGGALKRKRIVATMRNETLIGGSQGEVFFGVEIWGPAMATQFHDRCRAWLGDMVSYAINQNDTSLKASWRVLQKDPTVVRFSIGISTTPSP